MGNRPANKVLLIGWDAADWQVIDPLMESGQMPALRSMVEQGVMGNLSTLKPVLSPMLWNSIATGKRADKHGILGFIEPRPDGTGIQPVTSTSRKTKALWNVLSQNGLRSNVVNWYASHPAEPINGVCVSDRFAAVAENAAELPPVPPQSVHPADLAAALSDLRVRPKQMGPYHVAPFVPSVGEIPPAQTQPVSGIRKMLAKCAGVHAVVTDLMERGPWDFTAVYYEAIDHFCHAFMHYHPPRMEGIDPALFERYKLCVNGIYQFHDMMLGRLLELAGADTTVILVSDHGFLNDHLRPAARPGRRGAGPEAWHRFHGVFVMKGPGVRADERVYGASLLDVAPTVLTLFGLPVGRDMDGKVLAQCFERAVAVERIESWDTTAGPHNPGLHPPEVQVDPYEQAAAVRQLVELGYIAAPDADAEKAMKVATDEAQFNLAASLSDAGRHTQAADILQRLHDAAPHEARYRLLLADAYLKTGRLADVRRLLAPLADADHDRARTPQASVLLGMLEFAEGNAAAALRHLGEAERSDPRLPGLHVRIGQVYAKQRRWADAERAFAKAVEIDPDAPLAHYGLGTAALRQGRAEAAVEHTLRAVGLMHYFPRAHLQLGVALARLGWLERAAAAFETGLRLRPTMVAAHRYLAALYLRLNDPAKANLHAENVRRLSRANQTTHAH